MPNGERQQVVDRHQQRLAQNHRNGLLCRCRRGLQPVRRVAAIMDAVAVPPFVDRVLGRAETFRQHRRRLFARLDRSPNLGRRRRLLVKMDQHVSTPFRMSLRNVLAMKNADRRGSM